MIRKMVKEDEEHFLNMAEAFYASDAVIKPISKKQHKDTFNEIMRSNVYLEGYIFEMEGKSVGYAIIAKSFSQEAGGIVLWIDEIYVMKEYRSKGLGKEFFNDLIRNLEHSILRLRLEVASDNASAIKLYENMGFEKLEYIQMYKDRTTLNE